MRGVFFEESSIVSALEGQQPYLLYPGAESIDCQEVHLDSTSTVIVIDGTWSEAGKIVFRNPLLQRFPRISFKTTLESNYRIRKQPKRGYLSTIESIGHLLQLNARANGLLQQADSYDVLFSAFSKMVDQQLNYFPRMHKGNSTKI
jgi:DTW domain-containing protein YfiP